MKFNLKYTPLPSLFRKLGLLLSYLSWILSFLKSPSVKLSRFFFNFRMVSSSLTVKSLIFTEYFVWFFNNTTPVWYLHANEFTVCLDSASFGLLFFYLFFYQVVNYSRALACLYVQGSHQTLWLGFQKYINFNLNLQCFLPDIYLCFNFFLELLLIFTVLEYS